MPDLELQLEAGVVARRLVGREATDAECARYAEAITRLGVPLSAREQRLWNRMLARPRLYGAADAALALTCPASGIRQRGYTMLAVLEASPNHTDLFLARERSRVRAVAAVAAAGAAGVARACLGLVVVAATR